MQVRLHQICMLSVACEGALRLVERPLVINDSSKLRKADIDANSSVVFVVLCVGRRMLLCIKPFELRALF